MLNSLQIEQLLLLHGFTLRQVRTHALGYEHPQLLGQVIYLKDGRARLSEPRKEVAARPLVIHPSFAKQSAFSMILTAAPNPDMDYMNGNMADFPSVSGKSATGIALDVRDEIALSAILSAIGLADKGAADPEADIRDAEANLPTDLTEREAVIAARRGQGRFRKSLEAMWKQCVVTGCANPALLRASHIKPWRDSDNHDRLSPYNGLLLSAHVDAAFDRGLISFADDGSILLHRHRFSDADAAAIGIHQGMKLAAIHDQHKPYLAEHRRLHHFEK